MSHQLMKAITWSSEACHERPWLSWIADSGQASLWHWNNLANSGKGEASVQQPGRASHFIVARKLQPPESMLPRSELAHSGPGLLHSWCVPQAAVTLRHMEWFCFAEIYSENSSAIFTFLKDGKYPVLIYISTFGLSDTTLLSYFCLLLNFLFTYVS